jgi:hypothetical protein
MAANNKSRIANTGAEQLAFVSRGRVEANKVRATMFLA